jgi:hypothetical protein
MSSEHEAFINAAAAMMALPIAPEHLEGVRLNVERLAAMARLVMDFPLEDDVDPAPVFRP